MEKKGFVGHIAYGKTHEYYPLISKKEYTKIFMKGMIKSYFSNSFQENGILFLQEKTRWVFRNWKRLCRK